LAYNLLDLTTAVQDDLHDTSFSSTRIARYLNYGQLRIFNTHLFKFCEKLYSGTVASGATTKTQQTDQQSTINAVLIDPSSTTTRFIMDESTYLPHRRFFDQYPDPTTTTAGRPSAWTEFGGVIYFDRPTDKIYNFNQRYYRVPTTMSASTDVPDVPEAFRELLELYAAHRGEKYRGNHDIAATYLQEFEDGLENMTIRFSGGPRVGSSVMGGFRTRINE
jgi:hypothetical protein